MAIHFYKDKVVSAPIERVLVLDDNDGQALFWEMLLPEFKFTVFKSRAGAEGLDLVERENIQMIIFAWELSNMPGTLFIQKARSSRKRKRMPCLIYSKRMSPEDVAIAKEVGVENILPMPLNKESARTMIQQIIEREMNLSPTEVKLRKMEDCLAAGHPTDVLKMVGSEVTKKGPHLPRYKTIMAETFLVMGQFEKAEKMLREALELDPNYLQAKYLQARCFTAQGKHDQAIAILDAASNSSPKNIQSMVNLGSAYVEADDLEGAKKAISRIKDLDPGSEETKDVEGKIALKEGNVSLAAELFATTQNGDDIARFYNSLGISLIAKTQYDKGIETYQSAIKVLNTRAKVHLLLFNLGLAYRKKSDADNSFQSLCESYLQEPSFEKAYNAIARAVGEFKKENKPLPIEKIRLVKEARKKYVDSNPRIAEKLRKKMENKSKRA